jgi:RimJ/RimL family protein N-acetyltransferase
VTRTVHLPAAALRALAEARSPVPLSAWLTSAPNAALWRRRAAQVATQPEDLPRVTGVLWDDDAHVAVGRAGFHAAPNVDGMVELGYVVDPAHRRRGHARAALEGAIVRCQDDPAVRVLRMTISPDNEASLALARQYPFVASGEQWDEEDGLELIWEMDVS